MTNFFFGNWGYAETIFGSSVKPVLISHSKRTPKIGFQYRFLLDAGQKYCRMLRGEHSAILSTSIKLPFSIKTLILSIFKWLLKTGLTVQSLSLSLSHMTNLSLPAQAPGADKAPFMSVGVLLSCCLSTRDSITHSLYR